MTNYHFTTVPLYKYSLNLLNFDFGFFLCWNSIREFQISILEPPELRIFFFLSQPWWRQIKKF